jgi:hypothetical protein
MPKKQPVVILQPMGKGSKKDQKELARTQRLLNDNAPITRSVTAAFKEKHVRFKVVLCAELSPIP